MVARSPSPLSVSRRPQPPQLGFPPMAAPTTSRRGPGAARNMDDENLTFETSPGVEVVSTFDQMGIKDDLLRGIYGFGFEKPSAIQQRAVLPIINGRDVIAQAQSGTGKTSMISLTVCQIVDTAVRELINLLPSLLIHDPLC